MTRTVLVAAVVAAAVATGWGCTQSPGALAGRPSPAARLAQLEQELADLKVAQARLAEESAATAAGLRDERERAAGLTRERDELRTGLGARTAERDASRVRLDGFRQELKALLDRTAHE